MKAAAPRWEGPPGVLTQPRSSRAVGCPPPPGGQLSPWVPHNPPRSKGGIIRCRAQQARCMEASLAGEQLIWGLLKPRWLLPTLWGHHTWSTPGCPAQDVAGAGCDRGWRCRFPYLTGTRSPFLGGLPDNFGEVSEDKHRQPAGSMASLGSSHLGAALGPGG